MNIKKTLITQPQEPVKKPRGRNHQLQEKRDTCLAERYYYYVRFSTSTYEDILTILTQEFFLTRERIHDILIKQGDHLQALKNKNYRVTYLRRRWPHLNWV